MSQAQRTLKGPVVFFSVMALVFVCLSNMGRFFTYQTSGYVYSVLRFDIPEAVEFFQMLVSSIPYVLLFIYVVFFYRRGKATILVPIIFIVLVVTPFINAAVNRLAYGPYLSTGSTILYALTFGTFAMAAISAFKGLSNKVLILIPIIMAFLMDTCVMISSFSSFEYYLETNRLFSIFNSVVGVLSLVTLHIALLILGLCNKIPYIIGKQPQDESFARALSPAEELKLLQENFMAGMISPEVYAQRRAEIISKL